MTCLKQHTITEVKEGPFAGTYGIFCGEGEEQRFLDSITVERLTLDGVKAQAWIEQTMERHHRDVDEMSVDDFINHYMKGVWIFDWQRRVIHEVLRAKPGKQVAVLRARRVGLRLLSEAFNRWERDRGAKSLPGS